MLEIAVQIIAWFFIAVYAIKLVVGGIYIGRNKYPRVLQRIWRDDVFSATFHLLLLISLLLYNLGVV